MRRIFWLPHQREPRVISLSYPEKPAAVFEGDLRGVLGAYALDLGDFRGDILQIARIVALAAHRHGAEIRAVRLDEYAVERADLKRFYVLRAFL